MKIISFKQKGKTYELLDELNLSENLHGVQVMNSAVRVFIRKRKKGLMIKVIDGAIKAEGDVKDDKGLVLFKSAKMREET